MPTTDTCVTIVPYFKVHDGRLDEFRRIAERAVESTLREPDCLYYGFSYEGNEAHCREGYRNADAALTHLGNIGEILGEALKISDLHRLEVHGTKVELAKMEDALGAMNPRYFILESGFRR